MQSMVGQVTERIIQRSQESRQKYLTMINEFASQGAVRNALGCTNLAHGYAAIPDKDKMILTQNHRSANIGIVTAYNDMLSAHAPYQHYPDQIKQALSDVGAVGQVAGGVPAMCDGITQGYGGMELSLLSRDTIALSTAIALSHNVFDGVLMLGICDKIVPGLMMAALRYGHLPTIFVPAGPMPTGISNKQKAAVRQKYAKGEVSDDALLDSEMKSYHSQGTCTFYGTANSNQVLMEMLGVQMPGSSFVAPNTDLRLALTRDAAQRVVDLTSLEANYTPLAQVVDERALVNSIVGLLASGGSTNHTIHLVAFARMAGIMIDWQDLSDLSSVVPLLARIYPNGPEDINAFQRAGGMPFFMRELNQLGLLHTDVHTVMGKGLEAYFNEPYLGDATLKWRPAPVESRAPDVLTVADKPFLPEGGIKLLQGNLGRAVIKVSAVPESHWRIRAPVRVFQSQQEVLDAYSNNELNRDVIVVVIGQGPSANGMPELHKLIPALANLQDAGHRVALLTDGRLSGASGKVPAALHMSPEAYNGGPIKGLQDGDMVELDVHEGRVFTDVDNIEARPSSLIEQPVPMGLGRELFSVLRHNMTPADQGAISLGWE